MIAKNNYKIIQDKLKWAKQHESKQFYSIIIIIIGSNSHHNITNIKYSYRQVKEMDDNGEQCPIGSKQEVTGPTKLSAVPQHSTVTFSEPSQPNIIFTGNFQSGNLHKVVRNCFDHYSIWTASDCQGTDNVGYGKSWFYFRVTGFSPRKVTFSIHRLHFLWAMINKSQFYRPVYRVRVNQYSDFSEWNRLPHPIQSISINNQQQLVMKFDFCFSQDFESAEFAFIYPYTHEQCYKDLAQLQYKYQDQQDPDIFFKKYELCKSYQGRTIQMVIISSHEGKQGYENIKTDSTFTIGGEKLTKFRDSKPIIFISARVHPIQTPSSYTMNGIIKFLLDKEDYRAFLLRKFFVFVLVPMLNPDGVSNGHCRMDALNQNLNRYYNSPNPALQPSCHSLIGLLSHYSSLNKLFLYLDLHAHPAFKGNFIFGNAIFNYIEQVQSHLFPRILSQNCRNFQFQQCNFSRKHMKAKDRNQDMNKEGCGRVVVYKQFGVTHSYTLQCGYHCNTYDNQIKDEQNSSKAYIVRFRKNQKGQNIYDNYQQAVSINPQANSLQEYQKIILSYKQKKPLQNSNQDYRLLRLKKDSLDDPPKSTSDQPVLFTQQTFYNLGRNICITLLDIWNKNPYTRVPNANDLRIQIAQKQAKLDRFRKQQVGIKMKQKKIVQLIETKFYGQWYKRNVFQFGQSTQATISTTAGFKRNQLRALKRNQKSVTITEVKQQIAVISSSSKISLSKNIVKSKNSLAKSLAKQNFDEQKEIKKIQAHLKNRVETVSEVKIVQITSQKQAASIKQIKSQVKSSLIGDGNTNTNTKTEMCVGMKNLVPVPEGNAKNFFKPVNLRIRNMHIGNK